MSFHAHISSLFMQDSWNRHWDVIMRLLQYFKTLSRHEIFLWLFCVSLNAYCDSDYACCPLIWRLVTRHLLSHSSAKVEYRAITALVSELSCLHQLLSLIGVSRENLVKFYHIVKWFSYNPNIFDNNSSYYLGSFPIVMPASQVYLCASAWRALVAHLLMGREDDLSLSSLFHLKYALTGSRYCVVQTKKRKRT